MRFVVMAMVLVLAGAAGTAAAGPDLWIWRDRWNVIGEAFQGGYIVGVLDAVESLMLFNIPGDDGVMASALQMAHAGMTDRFPTIRSAVEWTNAEVAESTDPLTIVAATIIVKLMGPDVVAVDLYHGMVGKDRWTRLYPSLDLDGYVAGVFDIIRSLDNAGKSAALLRADVERAAGMPYRFGQRTHQDYPSIGDVWKTVRPIIAHSTDPAENMALAIFEALRRY